jgi:hypothetical protein
MFLGGGFPVVPCQIWDSENCYLWIRHGYTDMARVYRKLEREDATTRDWATLPPSAARVDGNLERKDAASRDCAAVSS